MRKEIFKTDSPDYRIVCKIGHKGFLGNVWWVYLQRAIRFKPYLFFGPTVTVWKTFKSGWYGEVFGTLQELHDRALKTFENNDPRIYWQVLQKNKSIQ